MLWDAFGNFRAACNTPKLPIEIKLRLLRAVEAIKRSCQNTQPDNPAAIFWITRISKSETLDDELLELLWASKEANEYITVTHGFYADVFNADLDASKLEDLPKAIQTVVKRRLAGKTWPDSLKDCDTSETDVRRHAKHLLPKGTPGKKPAKSKQGKK